MLVATAYHLCHEHSGYDSAALLRHFAPQLVAFMVGGGILGAAIPMIRNRLKRRISR